MKRLNQKEWTDGVHTYTGNPKDGFIRVNETADTTVITVQDNVNIVALDEPIKLMPAPREVRVDINFEDDDNG